jgi:hypothetical protein
MKSLTRTALIHSRHPYHYLFQKTYGPVTAKIFQYYSVNYIECSRFVGKYEYIDYKTLNTHDHDIKLRIPVLDKRFWEHDKMPVDAQLVLRPLNSRLKFFKRYNYKKYMKIFKLYKASEEEIISSCICQNTNLNKLTLTRYEAELKKKKYNNKYIYDNYYFPWLNLIKFTQDEMKLHKLSLVYGGTKQILENMIIRRLKTNHINELNKMFIQTSNIIYPNITPTYKKKITDYKFKKTCYKILKLIKESQFYWHGHFEEFFVDTPNKSRIIHGSHGFTGYIAENYEEYLEDDDFLDEPDDEEESMEPCYLINNTPTQITKMWPKSKLLTKKQENYFQYLEIRDQIFRYYYIKDGYTKNYNIIDAHDDMEDSPWRWKYCKRIPETNFVGGIYFKRVGWGGGYDFGKYFPKYNFNKDMNFRGYFILALLMFFYLSIGFKDYWAHVSHTDMIAHTYRDTGLNFFPQHNSNVTKAHVWFLDEYPIYLNIMPQTHVQSYALTLHSNTYKRALSKYSEFNNMYFNQNLMSWGQLWEWVSDANNSHSQHMDGFRRKPKQFKTSWIIHGHEYRYGWDGYIARRRLLCLPNFYDFLNDRRGSHRDLRNVNNTWEPALYNYKLRRTYNLEIPIELEEGKITSLTHTFDMFDLTGHLYRLIAYRWPMKYTMIPNWTPSGWKHHHDEFINFRSYPDRFGPIWRRYVTSGKHFRWYTWPDPWYYKHPFAPSRDFRKDFHMQVKGPVQDYLPQLAFRKWLKPIKHYNRLLRRNYMYNYYHPTRQTQQVTKAQNHLKKLIKFGYDISNTGVNNHGLSIVPSFLNFVIVPHEGLTVANILIKMKAYYNKHMFYYDGYNMIEKRGRWRDYLEIKPFFDYMVNYDRNKLNIINKNLSYYKMPNIDDDKVYLLEQYTRPKTRKKIKKKTFNLLGGIKYCDQLYPTFDIYEKFKHMSIFDPCADSIIYKSVKYSPDPYPATTKAAVSLKNDVLNGLDQIHPISFEDDNEFTIEPTPVDKMYGIATNAHHTANLFLYDQQKYMKFRTRLLIDQNRSKICIRKILKLYNEDIYNFN